MSSDTVVKTIQLIIVPVVMITACAIMQNGLIVHYNSLGNHLVSINQEILNLIATDLSHNPVKEERLHDLEHLILPNLFHRHHIIHDVLGLVYLAIVIQIFDMFIIAIAILSNISWLSQFVIFIFLIGVGFLFWGVILIAYELRSSHSTIQLEVHRNCKWCKQNKNQRNPKYLIYKGLK